MTTLLSRNLQSLRSASFAPSDVMQVNQMLARPCGHRSNIMLIEGVCMSLEVNRKKIDEVLTMMKNGEWQIPQFQREYIWSSDQVKKLILSILKGYPIGLITVWDQPQNNPHTPGEPLKLKGDRVYKNYLNDPAVIKLVLDGKQRLTTLAMVFDGFTSKNDSYSFSGYWFLNLSAFIENDESRLIVYKKKNETERDQLDTIANCINKMMIPFKDFTKLNQYIGAVNNPDMYPDDHFPDRDDRRRRESALTSLQETYSSFLVPFAEIPSSITLGDVCEIFDVLNTTGTKVSTFDLIHNLLFKDSSGTFNLREKFEDSKDLSFFGSLCDDNRQEFYCQILTGCYCLEANPQGRDHEMVNSIKGPDLINTPLNYYVTIHSSIQQFDIFAQDLQEKIFGTSCLLSEIPYPASSIIYFSLRWKSTSQDVNYTTTEIDTLFRSFFWRNVFCQRYDQGFLTQFSKDLRFLESILINHHDEYGSPIWNGKINNELDKHFGKDNHILSQDDLSSILLSDDTRGALKQGIMLYIKSHTKKDFVNGQSLNWGAVKKAEKVQIHHIFPQDWCNNNRALNQVIENYGYNIIANLCPLQSGTNNSWKALSPSTAISSLQIDYVNNASALDSAFIDNSTFDILKNDNVEEFWQARSKIIAAKLYKMQIVN